MSVGQPKFEPDRGALCHQRDAGQIPVCVVTDLKGRKIWSNDPGDNESLPEWVISSVTVYLQRFWSTSTATITLTCKLEEFASRPPYLIRPYDPEYDLIDPFEVADASVEMNYDKYMYDNMSKQQGSMTASEKATFEELKKSMESNKGNKGSDAKQKRDKEKAEGGRSYNAMKAQTDLNIKYVTVMPEDEICIYMGYLPAFRPIRLNPDLTVKEIEDGYLMRVYTGVIDTVTGTGTPKGVTVTIQCRDRMRFLMDTKVTINPKFSDQFDLNQLWGTGAGGVESNVTSDSSKPRSVLIRLLSNYGIGTYEELVDAKTAKTMPRYILNGRFFETGGKDVDIELIISQVSPAKDKNKDKANVVKAVQGMPPPDYFYNYPIKGGYFPLRARTFLLKDEIPVTRRLIWNIYTTRLGYQTVAGDQGAFEAIESEFTLENQVPVEAIKYIAQQEPLVTEVFVNHLDGEFYYSPRWSDSSGLTDPERFYRTYYYRNIPEEVGIGPVGEGGQSGIPKSTIQPVDLSKVGITKETIDKVTATSENISTATKPANMSKLDINKPVRPAEFDADRGVVFKAVDYNQMCINYKEDFSSIALKTNYIVTSSSPSNRSDMEPISTHLMMRPAWLRHKKIAGRNVYVIDETIVTLEEAIAVGYQYAKSLAKELKSASMVVIGDPTFCPGEIVQALGSPIYPDSLNMQLVVDERAGFFEYQKASLVTDLQTIEVVMIGATTKYEGKGTVDEKTEGLLSMFAVTSNDYPVDSMEQVQIKELVYKHLHLQNDDKNPQVEVYEEIALGKGGAWVKGAIARPKIGGFTAEPRTLWRVEGVRHIFNSAGQKGYTTELALLSPYQ